MMEKRNVILDDVVVLGKSYPYELRNGRKGICLAGWSASKGFIRIFPIPFWISNKLKRWNIISAKVSYPAEWRMESFKLIHSKNQKKAIHDIEKIGEYPKNKRLKLIESLPKNCPNYLNEKKVSLGLTEPIIKKTLFDKEKYYIIYNCDKICKNKQHKQQVLEWGVYQLIKKGYSDNEKIDQALGINIKD